MEFSCTTAYDQKAMTAMARAVRKTARRKKNRRSHIFGALIIALALLLTLPLGGKEFVFDFRTAVMWALALLLLLVLSFEDRLNGYMAGKRILPGLEKVAATFRADGYHSETEMGSSDFKYDTIMLLAETEGFFVFVFSQNHAQVYDKKALRAALSKNFARFYRM